MVGTAAKEQKYIGIWIDPGSRGKIWISPRNRLFPPMAPKAIKETE